MSHELSFRQNVMLGSVAAFIEGILLQPTLYWKNAKAQGLPFTINPRKLYRGTGTSIFNEMAVMSMQFGVTSYAQRAGPSENNADMRAAVVGGLVSAFLSAPIELIMIKQQLQGGGFFHVTYQTISTYGVSSRGLYRGLVPAIFRDSLYVGSMLGVTPLLQNYLEKRHGQSPLMASFNASICGGIMAAIPSHPFDIVKTCMQGDLDQVVYKSSLHTVQVLYRQGGFQRLLAGCGWRTVNIVSTVYIANECKNRLESSFRHF